MTDHEVIDRLTDVLASAVSMLAEAGLSDEWSACLSALDRIAVTLAAERNANEATVALAGSTLRYHRAMLIGRYSEAIQHAEAGFRRVTPNSPDYFLLAGELVRASIAAGELQRSLPILEAAIMNAREQGNNTECVRLLRELQRADSGEVSKHGAIRDFLVRLGPMLGAGEAQVISVWEEGGLAASAKENM